MTIVWNTEYPYFKENAIPEIKDLNVLIKFQKTGIASKLMDYAEYTISKKYNTVGIGVGLTKDYGTAQRLYIKRGYLPNGRGISQNKIQLKWGDVVSIDDDLVLYFTKKLGDVQ